MRNSWGCPMPMNRKLYPVDWEALSKRIREERAHNCCEICGVRNGAAILRSNIDPAKYIYYDAQADRICWPNGEAIRLSEVPEEYDHESFIFVVLTVGHLDHNPGNNDESNLRAMCQRCHLNYDRPDNWQRRRRNKVIRQVQATGQLALLDREVK